MKAFGTILVAMALLCGVAGAQNSDEQQVRKVMEENNAAIRNKDAATLNGQYADEYMRIGANGQTMNKAEAIKNLTSPDFKLGNHEFSDVEVHLYGDVAVATGISKYSIERNGQTTSHNERFVQIWRKQGGTWRLLIQTRTSTVPIPAKAYR
jgi:ketosteroid isomerase-like protein